MKKRIWLLLLVVSGLLIVGCESLFIVSPTSNHQPLVYEDDFIKATLMLSPYGEWADLVLANKTEKVIVFRTDFASYTSKTGISSKLAPKGTKYIDVNSSQPPISIPPLSIFQKSFLASESVYYVSGSYGGWRTNDWIEFDMSGSTFVFGYTLDGIDKFITFKGGMSDPIPEKSDN